MPPRITDERFDGSYLYRIPEVDPLLVKLFQEHGDRTYSSRTDLTNSEPDATSVQPSVEELDAGPPLQPEEKCDDDDKRASNT